MEVGGTTETQYPRTRLVEGICNAAELQLGEFNQQSGFNYTKGRFIGKQFVWLAKKIIAIPWEMDWGPKYVHMLVIDDAK